MFEEFQKIPRLRRGIICTEKLDGSNAQILITKENPGSYVAIIDGWFIAAGSRTRFVTPGKDTDNYGFAQWVADNAPSLVELGEGRHFGEWYGRGIGRNYGLDHRRFALFNTSRWADKRPPCCEVVPVIGAGEWQIVDSVLARLAEFGSAAVPGFMQPEGVIVYHPASRMLFKQTFDDNHKG